MAEVKWIKIVTDIFDDEKILLIESMPEADGIIVIWFKLLCLAGKNNNGGVFILGDKIAYTDEMLATIFRRKKSTVTLALKTFENFGMIEIVDNVITIPNWEKHQNIGTLEKIKEQNRQRVYKHREKQKALCNATSNVTSNVTEDVTVTLCNGTEEDKIRIDKIRIDNIGTSSEVQQPKSKKFMKPSVEEIKAYCLERKNSIDAERFFDYYEANGWKAGKNPMKDWKATVRNWEKNSFNNTKQNQQEQSDAERYDFSKFDFN